MMDRPGFFRWALILLAGGCNVDKLQTYIVGEDEPPVRTAAPVLTTRRVQWLGWSAVEQSNGLVTLRHVPAAGGRTLSLRIAGDDAFAVFADQQGKTYPADSDERPVHFGGHYTAIGPERNWSVHDQPFNPHAGPYDARQDTSDPERHELRLVSRPDTWRGATISIDRTIGLHRGNTHVVIDEKVTNRGIEPLTFHLWDFTQIDGLNRFKPGHPRRRLSFYLPVPVEANRKRYHLFPPPEPKMTAQFDETLPADVLAVHFNAVQFKIASHGSPWWIAAVDHDTGWTYVKTFDVDPPARYVDGNGPIELYGSGLTSPRPEPFVEMELLTGISQCDPGKSITQREHGYATNCRGPVLDLTPVGVVCEKMTFSREKEYCDVAGRFGVFYLGTARVDVFDRDDELIASSDPIPVDPRTEFVLAATVPVDRRPAAMVLEIDDHRGNRVGRLARLDLP